jgi:hypothetical protein
MLSPMSREDLQLLPMKKYEQRREMEVNKFVKKIYKGVLAAARDCRTSFVVPIDTRKPDEFKLACAILFQNVISPPKSLPPDDMAMVLSILKINLTSIYPDSTVMSLIPADTRHPPYILIDWS